MKNKKLEANLSMAVSKVFSGLNMNALKYLLPLWMSPLTGATLRCTFAAAAFWVIGWFMPPEKSSAKDKWLLFLLGALGLYGFMFLYLAGLSKTTPVSSSIFTSLQPIWVFHFLFQLVVKQKGMTAPICPEKSDNSNQQIKDKRKLLRLGMEYPLEKIDDKGIEQNSQVVHHHHKCQS